METEVQESVQTNSQKFKKVYSEILAECILRRKSSGASQADMAEMLNVDRRKIIEFEAGNGGVGLLLNYADIMDLETRFDFIKH